MKIKKYNLMSLIFLLFVIAFIGCSKKENVEIGKKADAEKFEKEKKEYESLKTPQELLKKIRGDKKGITKDEYIKLVQTLAYADYNKDTLMYDKKNITYEALEILRKESNESYQYYYNAEVMEKLLSDPSPQVRRHVFYLLTTFANSNNAQIKEIAKTAFKNEKDPFVLIEGIAALSTLKHFGKPEDTEIAQLIAEQAKSDNVRIRRKVAVNIGSVWFKGSKAAVDTELMLIDDKIPEVANEACEYSGDLNNARIVEKISTIMKDNTKEKLQGYCVAGLIKSWWHNNTNETAYKMTMDYFKRTPRTKDTPFWYPISAINLPESILSNFLKSAPYFNKEEFINVMKEIVKDTNSNCLARSSSIRAIAKIGTKSELTALGTAVKNLKDDDKSKAELMRVYERELKGKK